MPSPVESVAKCANWSVPTRAELRHVCRSGGTGGGLMARRNRNAYAAKWSKELTLLIPKGRGSVKEMLKENGVQIPE